MEDSKNKDDLLSRLKEQKMLMNDYNRRLGEFPRWESMTEEQFNDALQVMACFYQEYEAASETLRMLRVHGVPFHEAMTLSNKED